MYKYKEGKYCDRFMYMYCINTDESEENMIMIVADGVTAISLSSDEMALLPRR